MPRRWARTALVSTMTLVAGLGLGVAPTPALAAGCHAQSCEGRDPQALGCSADAYTIDLFTYIDERYELRVSRSCDAVWTRVVGRRVENTQFMQVRSYAARSGGSARRVYGAQVLPGSRWTAMVSYSQWSAACVSTTGPTGTAEQCTPRY